MISPKTEDINELLTRGVGTLVDPDGSFRKKLLENPKSITIKFGVDPTRPDIHLGHAVVFRKLRKFQDLGCKVIFLIGDITASIGDPSGSSKLRPEIALKEIEANMKTYLDQVGKILLTEPSFFDWTKNSDWFVGITDFETNDNFLAKLDLNGEKKEISLPANHVLAKLSAWEQSRKQKGQIRNYTLLNMLAVLRNITFGRLIGRDMFQERIKNGGELYMHEMMYPVLQGIDSSVLASIYGSCDLEVGGSDQTFNMLMGRDVMKMNKQTPQAVLAFELLEGLDGKEKMSKSLNNYIAITDEPKEMFGKVMSIPDTIIPRYFELCTYTPLEDVEKIKKELVVGKKNPKDIKIRLAREIVEIYHGREKAKEAEKGFNETFSKGGIPDEVSQVEVRKGELLVDILIKSKVLLSKTEFRRLIDNGAVEYMEKKMVVDSHGFIPPETGTFRIGKKRFLKIVVK